MIISPVGECSAGVLDLVDRYGKDRASEILIAADVEIATRRRALLAEGRASDPDFVLSKEAYDAAGEGRWIVKVDAAGRVASVIKEAL